MSSDLNACELESAHSIVISYPSELDSVRNTSENESQTQFMSVQTCNPEQRDLPNTG